MDSGRQTTAEVVLQVVEDPDALRAFEPAEERLQAGVDDRQILLSSPSDEWYELRTESHHLFHDVGSLDPSQLRLLVPQVVELGDVLGQLHFSLDPWLAGTAELS